LVGCLAVMSHTVEVVRCLCRIFVRPSFTGGNYAVFNFFVVNYRGL
jgi:hypothetical protein